MLELRSRILFRLEATIHPFQEIGELAGGHRRIAPVAGGTFDGPRLRGIILPSAGGDWLWIRGDGVVQLDVRITLQTEDGALIYMRYRGFRHGAPDLNARLIRGEQVPASEYYFRMVPFFETGHANYLWLNNIVSVGVGERLPKLVRYDVHEIV